MTVLRSVTLQKNTVLLRVSPKDWDKIKLRVTSKNNDQIRHYYYRTIKRINKLVSPAFMLDASKTEETNKAILCWWRLREKLGFNSAKKKKRCSKPRNLRMLINALERQMLLDQETMKKAKKRNVKELEGDEVAAAAAAAAAGGGGGGAQCGDAPCSSTHPRVPSMDGQHLGSPPKKPRVEPAGAGGSKGHGSHGHKDGSPAKEPSKRGRPPRKPSASSAKAKAAAAEEAKAAAWQKWEEAATVGVSQLAEAAAQLELTSTEPERQHGGDHVKGRDVMMQEQVQVQEQEQAEAPLRSPCTEDAEVAGARISLDLGEGRGEAVGGAPGGGPGGVRLREAALAGAGDPKRPGQAAAVAKESATPVPVPAPGPLVDAGAGAAAPLLVACSTRPPSGAPALGQPDAAPAPAVPAAQPPLAGPCASAGGSRRVVGAAAQQPPINAALAGKEPGGGGCDGAAKVKLQLFPWDAATRTALEQGGHNPHVELTLRMRKTVASVVQHLSKKWEGLLAAQGCQLCLLPFAAAASGQAGGGQVPRPELWGRPDSSATAAEVHAALGRPSLFQLRYGWLPVAAAASPHVPDAIATHQLPPAHAAICPVPASQAAPLRPVLDGSYSHFGCSSQGPSLAPPAAAAGAAAGNASATSRESTAAPPPPPAPPTSATPPAPGPAVAQVAAPHTTPSSSSSCTLAQSMSSFASPAGVQRLLPQSGREWPAAAARGAAGGALMLGKVAAAPATTPAAAAGDRCGDGSGSRGLMMPPPALFSPSKRLQPGEDSWLLEESRDGFGRSAWALQVPHAPLPIPFPFPAWICTPLPLLAPFLPYLLCGRGEIVNKWLMECRGLGWVCFPHLQAQQQQQQLQQAGESQQPSAFATSPAAYHHVAGTGAGTGAGAGAAGPWRTTLMRNPSLGLDVAAWADSCTNMSLSLSELLGPVSLGAGGGSCSTPGSFYPCSSPSTFLQQAAAVFETPDKPEVAAGARAGSRNCATAGAGAGAGAGGLAHTAAVSAAAAAAADADRGVPGGCGSSTEPFLLPRQQQQQQQQEEGSFLDLLLPQSQLWGTGDTEDAAPAQPAAPPCTGPNNNGPVDFASISGSRMQQAEAAPGAGDRPFLLQSNAAAAAEAPAEAEEALAHTSFQKREHRGDAREEEERPSSPPPSSSYPAPLRDSMPLELYWPDSLGSMGISLSAVPDGGSRGGGEALPLPAESSGHHLLMLDSSMSLGGFFRLSGGASAPAEELLPPPPCQPAPSAATHTTAAPTVAAATAATAAGGGAGLGDGVTPGHGSRKASRKAQGRGGSRGHNHVAADNAAATGAPSGGRAFGALFEHLSAEAMPVSARQATPVFCRLAPPGLRGSLLDDAGVDGSADWDSSMLGGRKILRFFRCDAGLSSSEAVHPVSLADAVGCRRCAFSLQPAAAAALQVATWGGCSPLQMPVPSARPPRHRPHGGGHVAAVKRAVLEVHLP
eukprot:jgi/Mesen1/3638/ME000020S03168